ncbi:MAG: hypothetical protein C0524_13750 [Rhodobacter sp.]|nr:hypothetical protein [Rhodobacter sp.]
MSVEAMGRGRMVVVPGMRGRDAMIKKAAYTINGPAAELEPRATVQEAAPPVFEVAPEIPVLVAPEVANIASVAPDATPAPKLEPEVVPEAVAEVMPEPVPPPVPELAAAPVQDISPVNAGAQAAIMAARLRFMIFSSF